MPPDAPAGFVTQRAKDDCVRAAVASLLGIAYELLPDVDHAADDWIGALNRALADAGWPFALITAAVEPILNGRWIAVVPSLVQPNTAHAVVMDRGRLLWDVGRKAKYQSVDLADVKCAIYLVATGPGWGPGRDSAWEPKELCS